MKKYLLPAEGKFYKANLHSHSTVSDGRLTPAQMKEIYRERGYSILCCTDHEKMVPHHELTDDDFLMLTGFEMSFEETWKRDFLQVKCCHICMIALEPDNDVQPCFHKTKYLSEADRAMVRYDPDEPDFEKEYIPGCINEAIRIGREKGFFVTYNHPKWSLERYEDYTKYEGMNAMEICNFGSLIDGYDEYNGHVYDDLLRQNKRIFVLGTDDNHNRRDPNCRMWDSFGAFTVIKSPSLDYRSVTKALEAGHFYASQGPEIYGLWLEDDILHVECSPADEISCITDQRRCMSRFGDGGKEITECTFELKPEDVYFRVTVTDRSGKKADTNAYFADEWLDAKLRR